MKCIISYMARKMWGGFVEGLPWCGFIILFTVVGVGGIYAFKMIMEWLRVDPKLAGALIMLALIVVVIICSFVELYREAKRYCDTSLEKEFKYYLDHQDELVTQYDGKVIVIKNQSVIGVFNSEFEAVDKTAKEYELGTFLVQKCEPGSESYTVTYHSASTDASISTD